MAAKIFSSLSPRVGFRGAMLGLSLLIGCSGSSPEPSDPSPSKAETKVDGMTAAELVEKMRSTYLQAKSYTDNASYVRRAVLRGEGVERETTFFQMSLAFERPNKLRFRFHEAGGSPSGGHDYDIASDGTKVRSSASSVPRQVHEAIAPLALTPENFIPEPEMRAAILGVSLENLYPPLLMLMADPKQRLIFPEDSDPQFLDEQKLGDVDCYRIRMSSPSGKRVLWIDKASTLLRRMELPIESQLKLLNPNDMFSQISIYVDFEDNTRDAEIDTASFELEIPEGVRRVRRFIPPAPAGPSPDLGKPVGDFRFATLEGKEVNKETLAGKLVILDFWFTGCPPCKLQTPILEKVYQAFKENEEVAFYSVSTDPTRISSEVVAKTMVDWGGSMPVLRDSESSGYEKLKIRVTPSVVVLDREGRLQRFQTGMHSHPEPLINAIQKLLDGEDLAANAMEEHERQLAEYEQVLDAATIKDSIVSVDVARPEIPPRRLPEHLQVEQLWQSTTEQLKQPGAVLALEEGASVAVLDAGMEIVVLDSAGAILGRHALPEHPEQRNGFLRSALDGEGQRWVLASGVGWQQVFLFNQQWESTLSFPDEAHSGIGDVLLADVAGTGTPVMYVGYWGGLGVQGGTLDGRRLWSNRRLDHVLQVAQGPSVSPQRKIWCTSTRGTVMQLSADGKPVKELYVTGHSLMAVAVAETGEESSARFCGLAVAEVGQYSVVGFDLEGSVQWQYELPQGEYTRQVPRIQPVRLGKEKSAWLVAAADGSLHWLSPTGELLDQFHYGEALTGVAMSYTDDAATLWIATDENLTAWEIHPMGEP
ncbi:MAG: redoxin domain-containing protein [Planctomycetes bacterium]|nr:redoxin domain-containing protein [Planctomycetota bacterium]